MLVKGLDYALLARRKAEIEAEKAAGMDDELDQLGEVITQSKGKEKAVEAPNPEKSNKVGCGKCVALARPNSSVQIHWEEGGGGHREAEEGEEHGEGAGSR